MPTKTLITIVEQAMDPLATKKFKPPIEQWRDEGREQGRKQGREQGREQGRAELLMCQLTARFGEQPKAVEQRLRAARREQLDTWAVRLLDAATPGDD